MNSVLACVLVVSMFRCDCSQYVVEELPVPQHASGGRAFDVDDSGRIVGEYTQNFLYQLPCEWVHDGNLWRMKMYPCSLYGVAVSGSGDCVVIESGGTATLVCEGVCFEVQGLGGSFTAPYATNAHGVVVGYALTKEYEGHAFVWQDGESTDILPDADFSVATSVNDAGDVAGFFQDDHMNTVAFVRADHGAVTYLPGIGGAHATTARMSDNGIISGSARNQRGVSHACLWKDGVVTDIGVQFPDTTSEAYDVNNSGVVIGAVAQGQSMAPFVWSVNTGMCDIQSCIVSVQRFTSHAVSSTHAFRLTRVSAINNTGDVVGWGVFEDDTGERPVFLRVLR